MSQYYFVQIVFPLRGERISNLIDFLREFFSIAGWEKKFNITVDSALGYGQPF